MSRKTGEKRRAVMEAAQDLFVECGFHGAPTSLIAQRAGVGVGTIYRYFRNKEELIHSIFDELHLRFHERFSQGHDPGAPLAERLTFLLGRLLAIFIESPRDFLFLEQYHYSPFSAADRQEIPDEEHNAIRRLLREGKNSGLFKDAPLPVLQGIALGPVIFLAKEHIAGRLSMDESTIRLATQACWDALQK
ncbi:MAG: TetR/AcrR family transcriptional regulator [bacterium]|nr:MAG: TetR/AcrR family transcriptional regulator [bacterium]